MKKLKSTILLVGLAVVWLLPSCIDDVENAPYTYRQLCVTSYLDDNYLFISDSGERLLAKSLPLDYEFEDDKRVMVTFSDFTKSMIEGYDYLIVLENIYDINTKDIIFINEENKDTLGNAPVFFDNIYASGNYLNLIFTFGASGNEKHYFNMSYDAGLQPVSNDTIKLTFHHKDNNDTWIQNYPGFISFDLRSLGDKQPEKPYILTIVGTKPMEEEFRTDVKVE